MNDNIEALLDRIAAGTHTEADLAALRHALLVSGHGNGLQIGKYNVQISASQNVHIGDVIYQGPEAAAICSALREVLTQASFDPASGRSMQAQLTHIVENLDALLSLWKSAYAEWQQQVASIQAQQIRNAIFDFSDYIADKTSSFVGRTFIFDDIDELVSRNRRGYIRVKGEPGIGKSALAAQLVKQKGYCHHFNIAAMRLNDETSFRTNIAAQLIARYALDEALWSGTPDQALFQRVLSHASQKASEQGEKLILVVDALDEADSDFRANTLGLPTSLPAGVFFVTTERKSDPRVRISIDPEQWSAAICINPSSKQNMDDTAAFLNRSFLKSGVQAYLDKYRKSKTDFVKVMKDKSAGNFMYLRYMVGDIELGSYDENDPYHLPDGLEEYYKSHWERMRYHYPKDEWDEFQLPILLTIVDSDYPVSVDTILKYAPIRGKDGLDKRVLRARVLAVLDEWGVFLRKTPFEAETETNKGYVLQYRYSFYHESYRDFLRRRVSMNLVESRIFDAVEQRIDNQFLAMRYGGEIE